MNCPECKKKDEEMVSFLSVFLELVERAVCRRRRLFGVAATTATTVTPHPSVTTRQETDAEIIATENAETEARRTGE